MSRILKDVGSACFVNTGDKVMHPVFEIMEVLGIYEHATGHDALCRLVKFNNTLRVFDVRDVCRLKYRKVWKSLIKGVVKWEDQ